MGSLKKILVILGPTATGKTDLALQLADKLSGEIVSADSRQVYKSLDIGTGKITNNKLQIIKEDDFWTVNGVKIWMYDVVSPGVRYSVAEYVKKANQIIGQIYGKDKLPIIVGGSGLYIKAILEGLPSLDISTNTNLRKKLEKLSLEELQKKLKVTALDKWKIMNNSDRQNPRRLIRAIELSSGRVVTLPLPRWKQSVKRDILKIGLTASREILYRKVDESVVRRVTGGMVIEAKELCQQGLSFKRMKQLGVEYGVLADYLKRQTETEEELIKSLQGKIHGYVRRQLTWFKKEKEVCWFDVTDRNFSKNVEKLVSGWYHQPDASAKV